MTHPWQPASLAFLAAAAVAAGFLSALTGFGGAAILLPALAWAMGTREAVPVLTVAQLLGNAARVALNRRELAWPVAGWFSLGGVPAAVAGGLLFAVAPLAALSRLLGGYLILIVIYRHVRRRRAGGPEVATMRVRRFAAVGTASGFLSALLGTAGPFAAPFFLAAGLVKGAYIGTEAATAVVMHVAKLGVYGGTNLLSPRAVGTGAVLGAAVVAGTWGGKLVVDRMPERPFVRLVDAALLVAGLRLLTAGLW